MKMTEVPGGYPGILLSFPLHVANLGFFTARPTQGHWWEFEYGSWLSPELVFQKTKDQTTSCKCNMKKPLPHSIVSQGPAQIQCGKGLHEVLNTRKHGSWGDPLWRLATLRGCSWTIKQKEHLPNGSSFAHTEKGD